MNIRIYFSFLDNSCISVFFTLFSHIVKSAIMHVAVNGSLSNTYQ